MYVDIGKYVFTESYKFVFPVKNTLPLKGYDVSQLATQFLLLFFLFTLIPFCYIEKKQ